MRKIIISLTLLTLILSTSISAGNHKLTGSITDEDGKPLIGILVSILPVSIKNADKLVTVTDVKGEYLFADLDRGKYLIAAATLDGTNIQEKTVSLGDGLKYRRDFVMQLKATKSMKRDTVDTEWILRSGKRDILRDRTYMVSEKADQKKTAPVHESPQLQGAIKLMHESYLSDKSESLNKTELNLSGQINETNNWLLAAQIQERKDQKPTLSAFGKYTHEVLPEFDIELGVAFKEYGNLDAEGNNLDEKNSWYGSLYTSNSFRIWEPLQLNCTLKYDHYQYYDSGDYLSPQVEIVYEPAEWAKMRGSFALETIQPDIVFSELDDIPTYIQDQELKPERALKYEISLEGGIGGGYIITFRAFYSDVSNKILNYFNPASVQTGRYLYNAGDSIVKGLSFDLSTRKDSWLSGSLSYSLNKAVVLDTERIALVFNSMNQIEALLGEEIAHELTTKLDAEIKATNTKITAVYKVVIGTVQSDDVSEGILDVTRLDMKIIQKLPFLEFTGTDWEIHLNVRNLFDSHGMSYFLNSETLVGLPRKISGGVSIYF